MKRSVKPILWLLLAVALIAGGYFLYQRWWNDPESNSVFGKAKGSFIEKVADAAAFVKERTGKTFEKAAVSSYSYAKKGAGETLASLGGGLESLGERISGTSSAPYASPAPASSASSTPSGAGTGFFVPPPLFSLSGIPGEPFLFSLNRAGAFSVSWGDGASEKIAVAEGETKTAEHSWDRKGDFEVVISFASASGREEWKFFVRVE